MNSQKPNPLAEDYLDPRKYGKSASELYHFTNMAKPKKDEKKPPISLPQEQIDELCEGYKKDELWMSEDRNVFFTEDEARAYTEAHFGELSYQHFTKTLA
jgi:hypothetical protein